MLKIYEERKAEYDSGQDKFSFKLSIFSSTAVRESLIQVQHKKCCYTEAILEDISHIEHFRPKTAIRDEQDSPRQYPGYFWLAYTWDNLVMCNPKVNGFKSDTFPLYNPPARARLIDDPLEKESPVLIDPTHEDPRKHIRFDGDAPFGISDRGKQTIDLLKLRHPGLRDKRMKILDRLDALLNLKKLVLRNTANAAEEGISLEHIESKLSAAIEPTAEFSSMAIDLLAKRQN